MNIIKETEKNFAEFIGTRHAIMVNSGTSALHTAYLSMDIKPSIDVIVPAYTYPATVNMVLACGGNPVFADIDPKTYLIDINDIFKKWTNKSIAVVIVNLFGRELTKKQIGKLDRELLVVVDSSQCIKPNINYGDIQTFSFYKTKNFSCFEGGAITTNNDYYNKQSRIIINQGENGKYNTVRLGYNYRISDLQAVMLNHQLMYHRVGGLAELGRWGPKDGHYPRVVYEQPLYRKLGYYDKYKGTCPIAEELAKRVRENAKI